MTDRLAGKVALITGGASGLGANFAELMVREGGQVMLADINEELGRDVAARIGSAASFVRLDVTSENMRPA